MPSRNFFWCNIKIIVIKTLLIKNNVAQFTIYIYIYIYIYMFFVMQIWLMCDVYMSYDV